MKRSILLLLIVGFVQLGYAQQVDRDEFAEILGRTINFENYTGSYSQTDSLTQIRGIGQALASGIVVSRDSRASFAAKYQVFHVVGSPDEPGKPADVLVFLPGAGTDHIDNVRRIIASYLSAAYKYSDGDANLLALFITIYNAVHRGNFKLFESRYKKSVLAFLSADKVGLSLSYRDWPGKSQIVIPLSIAIGTIKDNNQLTAVTTSELLTKELLETVRDRPDDGTAERQRLVELMERTREQEQRALEAERAKLEQERRDAQKRETERAREAIVRTDESSKTVVQAEDQASETVVKTQTRTETLAKVEQSQNDQQQSVAQKKREEELQARQEQNDQLEVATNQLRTETAKDLQNAGSAVSEATPVLFVQTALVQGLVIGKVQRVNIDSGQILAKNDSLQIIGRRLMPIGGDHLALVLQGPGDARLVLIANKDLSLQKTGSAIVSPYSEIVLSPDNQEILAVISENGEWYLGRFDAKLNPIMRSVIPVDPLGAISLSSGVIVVQRKDGRPTLLQAKDLTSAR